MTRLVTTSWDDGHPSDLRLAGILDSHRCRGTFYIAPEGHGGYLADHGIVELASASVEVGAHSLTHPELTRLEPTALNREVTGSKERLEDVLGTEVRAFCYPSGKFNATARAAVERAGFVAARTTVSFATGTSFDPLAMPVTLQLYNHSRFVHTKHALRELNIAGLTRWATRWGARTDPVALAKAAFDIVLRDGGVFHLWGHSWEIDQLNLWPQLEEILSYCGGRPECRYVTNSGVIDALRADERRI